jgi:uncharacterized protein (TIGR04255 family)
VEHVPTTPFEGLVPEIPLPSAPLVKVLAQLRYPRPLDFDVRTSIEAVRTALGPRYPVNRETRGTTVVLTPAGVTQQQSPDTNWIFEDIQAKWKITLGDQSVSIETTDYQSREDFCERLNGVIHVVAEALRPPVYDRLGVRYINRLEGIEFLKELAELVEPVALAGLVIPHDRGQLRHSLCDTLFVDNDAQLQVRWGWLPAGTTIDPTVPPPPVPYWLLDIDSFIEKGAPFDVKVLDEQTVSLSERAHRFFRWTVTDKFITRFGGQV